MAEIPSGIFSFGGGVTAQLISLTAPVPAGVMTIATDTGIIKVGDGVTLYNSLPILTTLKTLTNLSLVYATALAATAAAQASAAQAGSASVEAGFAANAAKYAAIQSAASAALAIAEITTATDSIATLTRQIISLSAQGDGNTEGPALIAAAGTTIVDATPIIYTTTVIISGPPNAGVVMPQPLIGTTITYVIMNRGPYAYLIYPYSTTIQFENYGAGDAVTINPGDTLHFVPVSPTLEYVY